MCSPVQKEEIVRLVSQGPRLPVGQKAKSSRNHTINATAYCSSLTCTQVTSDRRPAALTPHRSMHSSWSRQVSAPMARFARASAPPLPTSGLSLISSLCMEGHR
jgi:hypothetical protein